MKELIRANSQRIKENERKYGSLPPLHYILLLPILGFIAVSMVELYDYKFLFFELTKETGMVILTIFLWISSVSYTYFLILNLYLYFRIGMRIKGKWFGRVKKVNYYDAYPIIVFLILAPLVIFNIVDLLQIYLELGTLFLWILLYILFILIYFIAYLVAKIGRRIDSE